MDPSVRDASGAFDCLNILIYRYGKDYIDMRKIIVTVEKASDGYYWCRTAEEINGNTMLTGCGKTVAEAKADLLDCYGEAKADAEENGEEFEALMFTYIFDFASFSNPTLSLTSPTWPDVPE